MAQDGSPGGEARSVKSAERVFDILEHVMAQPGGAGFVQLGKELKIPKSSLFALLDGMERRQYLELDPESRRYRLGLRTLALGQAFLQGQDIVEVARRAMAALVAAVNETAQLARLAGRENVYLARVDSSHALRLQSEPGSRLPAHATGVGKALLAQLSSAELEGLFGSGPLETYGPTTLASTGALQHELELVRRRGFAIDNEEYTPGVFCLAVPIFDPEGGAACSVSISIPGSRVRTEALPDILARLAGCSLAISGRMGAARENPALTRLTRPGEAEAAIKTVLTSPDYRFAFL